MGKNVYNVHLIFTLVDHKRNDILKNLKIEPVSKFIQHYHASWKNHSERRDSKRIPNKFLHYKPHGKRSLRKTVKKME
jgi:hypothetical protein